MAGRRRLCATRSWGNNTSRKLSPEKYQVSANLPNMVLVDRIGNHPVPPLEVPRKFFLSVTFLRCLQVGLWEGSFAPTEKFPDFALHDVFAEMGRWQAYPRLPPSLKCRPMNRWPDSLCFLYNDYKEEARSRRAIFRVSLIRKTD